MLQQPRGDGVNADATELLATHKLGLADLKRDRYLSEVYRAQWSVASKCTLSATDRCVLADAFWMRCTELAANCAARPCCDADKLPESCTRVRLGYFRFSDSVYDVERSFTGADEDLLKLLTNTVCDDEGALVVIESATRAGIDDEVFYELLGTHVLTERDESYNDLYPFSHFVKKHPVVMRASAPLALACINMAAQHTYVGVMFKQELLDTVKRAPELFETVKIIDMLVHIGCYDPSGNVFALQVLQRMRPRALHALGAAERLAEMVRDTARSKRRLAALERLIRRIEAPEHMDMEEELRVALGCPRAGA